MEYNTPLMDQNRCQSLDIPLVENVDSATDEKQVIGFVS
jgi:hypothetical protein